MFSLVLRFNHFYYWRTTFDFSVLYESRYSL